MCNLISNRLSKTHYTMVKIIMSIRLLLGLYSKIHESFMFAIVAKTYCLLYITAFIFIFGTYGHNLLQNLGMVLVIMTVISAVILSLLTDGEHLFHYIQELDKVDPLALVAVESFQVPVSFVTLIAISFANIHGYATLLSFKMVNKNIITIFFILSLTSHTSHMTRILMFEILWTRVKSLRKTMENWRATKNDANDERVQLQIKNLEEYLFIYRNILQCTKIIGHSSKFLMLLFLSTSFVSILDVANILTEKETQWNIARVMIVEAVILFAAFCIPALFGERIKAEVENIKINLARQFKICNNDAVGDKILIAIKFINMCPINFTVWRLFSVDFSLSLAVFNLCTTYTIVLLQFKKVKI